MSPTPAHGTLNGNAYADNGLPDLQAEVDRRGLHVKGSGASGNVVKADLVAALTADDTRPVHDTARPDDGRHYALALTLGGAPNTLHVIPDLGYVRADPPAPVGGPGEPTLPRAIEASKQSGAPVELVELTAPRAEKAREAMQHARLDANRALAHARQVDGELAQDRIDDETAALLGGQEA